MSPQSFPLPDLSPIESSMCARIRLLQKKHLVDWTDERWADAIAELTGGVLAPARFRLWNTDEWSSPVPYLETSIHPRRAVILSRKGISKVRHNSYDSHEWEVSSSWTTTPQITADAELIQKLMGSDPLTAKYMLGLESFQVDSPVVHRHGETTLRFPVQDWHVAAKDPTTIPDFPDRTTMLQWLQRSLSQIPNIYGPSFFALLSDVPALSKWLQRTDDWQAFTQNIKPTLIADLDTARLPDIKQPWFLEWMESVSPDYNNARTLIAHYQKGATPTTASGKRLLDAFNSWASGDVSALCAQETKITARVLAVFCSAAHPPPATKAWLEKTIVHRRFESEALDVVRIAEVLSSAPSPAPEAWFKLLTQYIDRNNIEKQVASNMSLPWRQQILLESGAADVDPLPAFKFLVIFRQSLLDTPEQERGDFLCDLLANRSAMSPSAEASFVRAMHSVCAEVWPEHQSYFDTITSLEPDFRLWPALIRDRLARPQATATLPDLEVGLS